MRKEKDTPCAQTIKLIMTNKQALSMWMLVLTGMMRQAQTYPLVAVVYCLSYILFCKLGSARISYQSI